LPPPAPAKAAEKRRNGRYPLPPGPIPLHHDRQRRKGRREQRADRVTVLARAVQVPNAVLKGRPAFALEPAPATPRRAFIGVTP
jgi:hypothetical protein